MNKATVSVTAAIDAQIKELEAKRKRMVDAIELLTSEGCVVTLHDQQDTPPPPPPPPPEEGEEGEGDGDGKRGPISSPSKILKFSYGNKIEAALYALGGAVWETDDPDPLSPKYVMPLTVVPAELLAKKVIPEDGFNLPSFTRDPGKFVFRNKASREPRPIIYISEFEKRMQLPYLWNVYLLNLFAHAKLPDGLRIVERHGPSGWIYTAQGWEIVCKQDLSYLGALAPLYRGIFNVDQDPNALPEEELKKKEKFRTLKLDKAFAVKLAEAAEVSKQGIAKACDKLFVTNTVAGNTGQLKRVSPQQLAAGVSAIQAAAD
jgi:hypothetical protein